MCGEGRAVCGDWYGARGICLQIRMPGWQSAGTRDDFGNCLPRMPSWQGS